MDHMAERIKRLRELHGLTLEDVGNAVGVSKSTVHKWEIGEIANMRRDKIAALATALHTTPAYLMGWEEEAEPPLPLYQPKTRIPILGRVAAGLPLLAEQNIDGYVCADYDDGEIYYALRVQGDSMTAAGIDPGDLVIVRQQPDVDPGQIAVVLVNGDDATIKYVQRSGGMTILLPKSSNPVHQPQIYGPDIPVRIIGRVVEIRKKV